MPNVIARPATPISTKSTISPPVRPTTADIDAMVPINALTEGDDHHQPVTLGDVVRVPRRAAVAGARPARPGELESTAADPREGHGTDV